MSHTHPFKRPTSPSVKFQARNSRLPNEITRPAGSGSETPMGYGLDVPAIPRDQTGKREKMSRSVPLPSAPTVGVLTRGSGSQLVNATCFLVPNVDARGNTVMHRFILVPAMGPYVQQRVCESTVLSCTGGACSRGISEAREGGKLPGLC